MLRLTGLKTPNYKDTRDYQCLWQVPDSPVQQGQRFVVGVQPPSAVLKIWWEQWLTCTRGSNIMLPQRVWEIPSGELTGISTVLVSSWLLQGCWQERNNQPLLSELQQGQTKCLHISSNRGKILQPYDMKNHARPESCSNSRTQGYTVHTLNCLMHV